MEMNPNWRVDDLQIKGYQLIQDPSRFCFGIDAVLLSSYGKVHSGEKVIDFCTGNGVIPVLMEAKSDCDAHFIGLEIQEESAALARKSVELNHLQDKIEIVQGDLRDASKIFRASSFDVVTCNPPYMIAGDGIKNPDDAKSIARHEVLCDFDDVVRETARILKMKGRCYFVHRPFRLVELLSKMSAAGIEPKRMRLVYPYVDKEPNMVLIEGMKGGKGGVKIEPPLIVYKAPGEYTDEIYDIYGYERP